jgi:hypothetical protein
MVNFEQFAHFSLAFLRVFLGSVRLEFVVSVIDQT